jgi:hypothetical protein
MLLADEVFVKVEGKQQHRWRAVIEEGKVLASLEATSTPGQ